MRLSPYKIRAKPKSCIVYIVKTILPKCVPASIIWCAFATSGKGKVA